MKVADVDEAIGLANDTPYGLTASIWTGDKDKGLRIASKLKAGCICLNNRPIEVAPLPWGGIKQSGVGRTSSRYGLLNFVNIKCITIDTSKKPDEDHWYPYGKSKERYYQDLFDYVHSDLKCDLLKAGLKMINGPDKEK
jgi:hypothetical protein